MKVVFHVNSLDNYSVALSNIRNILQLDVTVVILLINGSAIKVFQNDELNANINDKRFSIYACQNSMTAHRVTNSDLFDNTIVIASGVYTLTELQTQGFAYIKP